MFKSVPSKISDLSKLLVNKTKSFTNKLTGKNKEEMQKLEENKRRQ